MRATAPATGATLHLALRTGLPFGAVMATGVSSQVARAIGVRFAVPVLLWLTVAETVGITARGIVRHRAEFHRPWTTWARIGPPAEHGGVLTVPVGFAVTAAGFAAGSGGFAASMTVISTGLTWLTTAVFVTRFAQSALTTRPPLRAVGGDWLLPPAALFAATVASVAGARHIGPDAGRVLLWAGLLAAAAGAATYWGVSIVAAVRVSRYGLDGSRRVQWWIWAGCGGLAGVAMADLAAAGSTLGMPVVSALRALATATWAVGALLLVPVVVLSARHLFSLRAVSRTVPWPPTFSTAVVAVGAVDVGRLTGIGAIDVAGLAVGYATLTGWVVTAVWNATALRAR